MNCGVVWYDGEKRVYGYRFCHLQIKICLSDVMVAHRSSPVQRRVQTLLISCNHNGLMYIGS